MSFVARWKSESGQMAIFVALIFQVLFVFFAMVINISMIVHDKIVLQNSVDLAAYYAAQKQAEVLNQMGHINFQIRQSNKLLAWRQWVLGDLGAEGHPLRGGGTPPLPPLTDELDPSIFTAGGSAAAPGMCITHQDWEGTVNASVAAGNHCQEKSASVPALPSFTVSIPFVPIFDDIRESIEAATEAAATSCRALGPTNWAFASRVQMAYRVDVSLRKRMLLALADQISQDPNDFRDIRGDSVLGGATKVVRKNVNQSYAADTEVELLNSLALGPCGSSGFISDIVINPLLTYADFSTAGPASSCDRADKYVSCDTCRPHHAYDNSIFSDVAGEAIFNYLQIRPFDLPPDVRPSLGFEKNPWCMAYVGVRASMTSRKPFGPFGRPVVLHAQGFAKPFGGSLGPWYSSQWAPGQEHSHGTERLDPLAPIRELPGSSVSLGGVANFSRYPGDSLGYSSLMERGALRGVFLGPGNFGSDGILIDRKFYQHIAHDEYIERTGNVLADSVTDPDTSSPHLRLRQIEMTAVAPDLYDITYYPVEPGYYKNYLEVQRERGLFEGINPISDLGSHFLHEDLTPLSVELQVNLTSHNPTGGTLPYAPEVFYKVRSHEQLLSWWVPGGLVEYGPPGSDFMSCPPGRRNPGNVPNPGMCVGFGRVGHSVKLVHKDYLSSEAHRLGGADAAEGGLLNAPASAGW